MLIRYSCIFQLFITLTCFASSDQIEETNDILSAADVEIGRDIAIACSACHSFVEHEPNPRRVIKSIKDILHVGPNLFGVYKRKIAGQKGFGYSEALKEHNQKIWTVDRLDQWIKDPRQFVNKTIMPFNGLLDPQDRADVIAFLMTLKK